MLQSGRLITGPSVDCNLKQFPGHPVHDYWSGISLAIAVMSDPASLDAEHLLQIHNQQTKAGIPMLQPIPS